MTKLPIAAALLLIAAPAFAQTPPAAPAAGVSFEQWAVRARDRMMALDTDKDGKISKDEMAARAGGMGGGMGGPAPAPGTDGAPAPKRDGSRMLTRMDTNNDGFVDAAEMNAMLARRFARQDANHDGVLTADERQPMRGPAAAEQ